MTTDSVQTLLVLGASGDLTARLLLPGLAGLLAGGAAPGLALVGSGTDDWDDERWRSRVTESFAAAGGDPAVARVAGTARYLRADVTRPDDLRRLLAACEGRVAIFFALPPAVTAAACAVLADIGVPAGTRLVLEKPFGTDAQSARQLNELLSRLVPEDQVHRVDHFLGKSTVLNILGLRFANRIFEPLLSSAHVESVDIVFDESLALEGRAGYYDRAGALADMIQSHLLQVLALLVMEAPPTLDAREFRDRKAQVLRATRLWDDDPAACSRRARYAAGAVDGRQLPAYADEAGVDPARGTETLAELVVAVDTWRWAGVPFRLRSGKALSATRKEAVITFKPPQRVPDGLTGWNRHDRLRIGFGPDRLHLDFSINGPGDPFVLDPVTLDAEFGPGDLPPYGEVLRGVLEGDPTLSVRGDTAEECWRIVDPVLAAWRSGAVPLLEYPAGSTGPADSLLRADA
ncbi:glucose-6-phosphate dehydrogenase [Spirilliplanes yamanashiensis]|uniref:Glucose-6-phosphate 1-dehydrogenase n=1 Tax=Spirilliplanes yamanashiensis TaxID=42233 RepID=A0A8J3YAD3_9ACTN|nr:glucose-6-phosphate dehydrogenase [Spirilliplanes yamanashiensis]MDP9818170.1 glucose-6-phosphate 1-dehydrogenase [Spirilliplanes yamanashiensis]GIJ04981.1 glucose-6-phosphate 1-dehydrogenase [Spirilliplanes yamanashiensis]